MKKWLLLAVGIFLAAEGPLFQGEPGAIISPETGFTNVVQPVWTAFHVMPPVGTESPDLFICDPTLTEFLKVIICQPQTDGSCTTVETLTSERSGSPLQSIVFQDDEKYHVNCQDIKDYAGMTLEFRFSVADLDGPVLTYSIASRANSLPIQFVVENNPLIRARVLHRQGFSATDIAQILLTEFGLGDEDILMILRDEGFPLGDIATAAKICLQLTASRLAEIFIKWPGVTSLDFAYAVKVAGYSAAEAYAALRDIYGLSIDPAAAQLKYVGYEASSIFNAIVPDLRPVYKELIARFGPVVYLHSQDQYRPSSVDWFLAQSMLEADNGACLSTTPETLSSQTDELLASGATRVWLNPSTSTRPGDISTAKFYVNAVRVPDYSDILDLQFWIFYPFNGPRTITTQIKMFEEVIWGPTRSQGNLQPLAEHIGDWEILTLRFRMVGVPPEYNLEAVYLQQHGEYKPYGLTDFSWEGEHIVVYSSLNGHAFYKDRGDNRSNPRSELASTKILGETIEWGEFEGWLSDLTDEGPRLNSWDCSELVHIYYSPLADPSSWTKPDEEKAWTWLGAPWMGFGKTEQVAGGLNCCPQDFYNWIGWGWGFDLDHSDVDLRKAILDAIEPLLPATDATMRGLIELACTVAPEACPLVPFASLILAAIVDKIVESYSDEMVAEIAGKEWLTGKASTTPRFRRGMPCTDRYDGEWIYRSVPLKYPGY